MDVNELELGDSAYLHPRSLPPDQQKALEPPCRRDGVGFQQPHMFRDTLKRVLTTDPLRYRELVDQQAA